MTITPLDRIDAQFGEGFARELAQAVPGRWRCNRPMGCIWSWSQQLNQRRCRYSSRCGRQWSASGSPSTPLCGARVSVPGPCGPASNRGRVTRHDAHCRLVRASSRRSCYRRRTRAHEVRPGFLELRETEANDFSMTWKVPAFGAFRLGMEPRLPGLCRLVGQPISLQAGGAFILHGRAATVAWQGRRSPSTGSTLPDRGASADRECRRQRA